MQHVGAELEGLADHFGKRFVLSPTQNCKQIATTVANVGIEADVRATASIKHSLSVHQSTMYQQHGRDEETVDRYVCYESNLVGSSRVSE